MRQSEHEKGLIGFTIDENGITFGDRIEGVSGMLGWSALQGDGPEEPARADLSRSNRRPHCAVSLSDG